MKNTLLLSALLSLALSACSSTPQAETGNTNLDRATQTLDSIYKYYSVDGTTLLRETYPFDTNFKAGYLAEADTGKTKEFAYLWPFSCTFSGVNALLRTSGNPAFLTILKEKTLPALDRYYDDRRLPPAYASYLNDAPLSDRFYDDNVWIGIDFLELYAQSDNKLYLEKAQEVWRFIESGTDEVLGGGIYWCEQKKFSKNTCSNAPGSVMAFKLFEATGDSAYFQQGLALYNWTKTNLQDPDDKIYWDNVGIRGNISKAKFPYNSGQMLQSASLLYKLTGDEAYLKEAQELAAASIRFFTDEKTREDGSTFRLMKPGNVWFVAVMVRGFVELYHLDGNIEHINTINESLDYAWEHARDANGFFPENWEGRQGRRRNATKKLIDQAAFVEMYANIASIIKN